MRKTLNFLLPVFLILLGYLVYMQWFSPSKPLLYLPPEKATFPSQLSSLPINLLSGKEETLDIKGKAYTIFVVDIGSYTMGRDFSQSFYMKLKRFHELLSKKDTNIVYLWSTNKKDEVAKLAELVETDPYAKQVIFDQTLKAQFQKNGLQIINYPIVFVYSQEGEMIFQQHIMPSTMEDLMSLIDKGK